MNRLHSFTALALTGMVGFSTLCAPMAARASEEGKRNTAIGLGVAAAALLLTQKNKVPGLVVAGGALIALSQTGHNRNYRDRNDDRYYNDRRNDRDDRYDRSRQDDRNRDHRDNDRNDRNSGYRYGDNDRNDRNSGYHYGENDRFGNQDSRNRDRYSNDYNRSNDRYTGFARSGR